MKKIFDLKYLGFVALTMLSQVSWAETPSCTTSSLACQAGLYSLGQLATDDARGVTVAGHYAYVADGFSGTKIIDIRDPGNPLWVGGFDTAETDSLSEGIHAVGSTVFIADGPAGFKIVDASNPLVPVLLSSLVIQTDTIARNYIEDVKVVDHRAYLSAGRAGLVIVDISDLRNPKILGTFDTDDFLLDVAIDGDIVYLADDDVGIVVVDVSDPAHIHKIGYVYTNEAGSVALNGDYLYVADGFSGVRVIDVSDPTQPQRIYQLGTEDYAEVVRVAGNRAYVAVGHAGIKVLDISNPARPVLLGTFDTVAAQGLSSFGNKLYIADGSGGLNVVDVSHPSGASPAAVLDIRRYTRSIHVIGNRAYAVGDEEGMAVVGLDQPDSPTFLASLDTESARAVQVVGNRAYVADASAGLKIVDIRDSRNPRVLGSLDTDGESRSVDVSGDYAYLADGAGGLKVIRVADAASPEQIGWLDTDGAEDVVVVGHRAYIADGRSGLKIIDVQTPDAPVLLGRYDSAGYAESVYVVGERAYIADAEQGLSIVDVRDPVRPFLLGHIDTDGRAEEVTVSGDRAYLADGKAGLKIVNVADPRKPTLAASIDIEGYAEGVQVVGERAYLAAGSTGLKVLDIPAVIQRSERLAQEQNRVVRVHQVTHAQKHVALSGFQAPVVILGAPSYNGTDPGGVRLRNVAANGFDLRFNEWDYKDGHHVSESVSQLVFEQGRQTMADGSLWEAGTFNLSGTGVWQSQSFQSQLPCVPTLLLTTQTSNGGQMVVARARNASPNGFEAAFYEQQSLMASGHVTEKVGYLAVCSVSGSGQIEIGGQLLSYRLRQQVVNHEWTNTFNDTSLKLEEEQSSDDEVWHVNEQVDVLELGSHVFAQIVSAHGPDPVSLRRAPVR